MARQSITNDIAAQICWQYLHGGFKAKTNEQIHRIINQSFSNKSIAIRMVLDIAYRIGYAKSELMDYMGERCYKEKKKLIRDKLVLELNGERGTNERNTF